MDFVAPTNAIITLPFEVQIPDEGAYKGQYTIVIDNISVGNLAPGTTIGKVILLVNDNEPSELLLKTAAPAGGED